MRLVQKIDFSCMLGIFVVSSAYLAVKAITTTAPSGDIHSSEHQHSAWEIISATIFYVYPIVAIGSLTFGFFLSRIICTILKIDMRSKDDSNKD